MTEEERSNLIEALKRHPCEKHADKNDITYKATELFEGNESVALHWCNEPSRTLQWETPSQITKSKEGAINICLSIQPAFCRQPGSCRLNLPCQNYDDLCSSRIIWLANRLSTGITELIFTALTISINERVFCANWSRNSLTSACNCWFLASKAWRVLRLTYCCFLLGVDSMGQVAGQHRQQLGVYALGCSAYLNHR